MYSDCKVLEHGERYGRGRNYAIYSMSRHLPHQKIYGLVLGRGRGGMYGADNSYERYTTFSPSFMYQLLPHGPLSSFLNHYNLTYGGRRGK